MSPRPRPYASLFTTEPIQQVLEHYGQSLRYRDHICLIVEYNLEDTHLTHPQRVHLLLGLLAWTLLWALLVGPQYSKENPSP